MIPLIALAAVLRCAAPARAQEAAFPQQLEQQQAPQDRQAGSSQNEYVPPDGMQGVHPGKQPGRAAEANPPTDGRQQPAPPDGMGKPAEPNAASGENKPAPHLWHPEWTEDPPAAAVEGGAPAARKQEAAGGSGEDADARPRLWHPEWNDFPAADNTPPALNANADIERAMDEAMSGAKGCLPFAPR